MPLTHHTIDLPNGVSLHTGISTPSSPPRGPALLLLHFWGGSNRAWSSVAMHLQSDFTIIAPSLRGWGLSSKPQNAETYGMKDFAEDIVLLLRELQASQPELLEKGVVFAGHSMGGKIAQVLLTRPEIQALLKGVVLVAPAPAGSFRLPDDMREQQIHAYDAKESTRFVIQNVLLSRPDAISEEQLGVVVDDAFAGGEAARKAWPGYGMAEDYEKNVVEAAEDWEKELKVLVVLGELDGVETMENVEKRVVRILRDAGALVDVEVLMGVGHLVPVEAGEALGGKIERFVGKLS